MKPVRGRAAVLALLLLVSAVYVLRERPRDARGGNERLDGSYASTATDAPGNAAVRRAFDERTSGRMLSAAGTVSRILADDDEGSRHQRFVLELDGRHTLLVSHNIDLAPRVPVRIGDRVSLYGQYEWNDRGGVMHWTHHDPRGTHEPGWIEHAGRRYE